jgi:hypothetical protein
VENNEKDGKKFEEKFLELFKLISEDKKRETEFSEAKTLEESHKVACGFVGFMDFNLYKLSMEKLAEKNKELTEDNMKNISGGFDSRIRNNKRVGKLTEDDLRSVSGGISTGIVEEIADIVGVGDIFRKGSKIGSLLEKIF